MEEYQFRQCEWDECRFRFPVEIGAPRGNRCPTCGSATYEVGIPAEGLESKNHIKKSAGFRVLLDNIRSIHNVGSIFRTADGAGMERLHLGGMTATPAHPKLAKAALGAQDKVTWSYSLNGLDTVIRLREEGFQLWGLEATAAALPFFDEPHHFPPEKLLLVVGNERAGIDPAILDLCDRVYSLPMRGFKRSLNVSVAFGIVAYHLSYAISRNKLKE